MKLLAPVIALCAIVLLASCNGGEEPDPEIPVVSVPPPAQLRSTSIAEYPHDTSSFIQGLQWYKGKLYESTGNWENSAIKQIDPKSGRSLQTHIIGTPQGNNNEGIFGEGITIMKDSVYQLTWMNHLVYVYHISDITKPVRIASWPFEGWGITNDSTNLIISDGKPGGYLYFVDPVSFNVIKKVQVLTDKGVVQALNELEFIDGFIYANVWQTDFILKINPANGHVAGILNVKSLLPMFYASYPIVDGDNVLNGIAFEPVSRQLYITGKRWPKLFVISLPQ